MLTIDDLKSMYLDGTLPILSSATDEDGCDTVVIIVPNGFEILTYQKNGHTRDDIFEYLADDDDENYHDWYHTESFCGRWEEVRK